MASRSRRRLVQTLSLLDRGVIYVIAHIRGGGEMGEEWRDAGRMMKKMNTFTDFIAAGEYLVKNKYTSSDRLVNPGRQRRWHAGWRGHQHAAGSFQSSRGPGAFRRCAQYHVDRPCADHQRYIEWGNPKREARIRLHSMVLEHIDEGTWATTWL